MCVCVCVCVRARVRVFGGGEGGAVPVCACDLVFKTNCYSLEKQVVFVTIKLSPIPNSTMRSGDRKTSPSFIGKVSLPGEMALNAFLH